jgi:gliding motility-associated-like protein
MILSRSLSALCLVPLSGFLVAQVPTQCLEIERILVDACISSSDCPGSQEGQNEMVRFRVGPQPIALSDLSVDWPNNSFQGLVQNGTTASVTAALNASVTACGLLLEPPGGVIPAGASVLLITSTAMCTQANSFAGLADTLYVIFQQAGNTQGHFANHNNGSLISPVPTGGSSTRTLVITQLSSSCSDVAIYDRQELVNMYGSYGGMSAENDGATVSFTWPGAPVVTNSNSGCQAPVPGTTVVATAASSSICAGGTVSLAGSVNGGFASVQWSGGTGSFSTNTDTLTSYTAGSGDVGPVVLTFCAIGTCGQSTCDTVVVLIDPAPAITITSSGPPELCPGETLDLLASGGTGYVWSTNATTAQITVTTPGVYAVTGSNACGQSSSSITIGTGTPPFVSITGGTTLCQGATLTLTGSGADSYLWSTGATTATIQVNSPGTIGVIGTTACGQDTASVVILPAVPPVVQITGELLICPDGSTLLTASAGVSYLWSTGATTQSIPVSAPGSFTVTVSNGCASASVQVQVDEVAIDAAFTAVPNTGAAPLPVQFTNGSIPANAGWSWGFGDGGTGTSSDPLYTYTTPGTYIAVLTVTLGDCTDETSLVIVVEPAEEEPPTIIVPNVFSPNGDGRNDQLQVITTGISDLTMDIFNRWGQRVGGLSLVDQRWDGRDLSGIKVVDGTYFYALEAHGDNGTTFSRSGTITVLR